LGSPEKNLPQREFKCAFKNGAQKIVGGGIIMSTFPKGETPETLGDPLFKVLIR